MRFSQEANAGIMELAVEVPGIILSQSLVVFIVLLKSKLIVYEKERPKLLAIKR